MEIAGPWARLPLAARITLARSMPVAGSRTVSSPAATDAIIRVIAAASARSSSSFSANGASKRSAITDGASPRPGEGDTGS